MNPRLWAPAFVAACGLLVLVACFPLGPQGPRTGNSGPHASLLGAYLGNGPLGTSSRSLGCKLDVDDHYGSIVVFDFGSLTDDLAAATCACCHF